MSRERRGFTVREFVAACKRNAPSSYAHLFGLYDSQAFLLHLCRQGLLVRDGAVYVPTYDLYAVLDVPPPLSEPPPSAARRNGTRART
jgi:hypothetical protein